MSTPGQIAAIHTTPPPPTDTEIADRVNRDLGNKSIHDVLNRIDAYITLDFLKVAIHGLPSNVTFRAGYDTHTSKVYLNIITAGGDALAILDALYKTMDHQDIGELGNQYYWSEIQKLGTFEYPRGVRFPKAYELKYLITDYWDTAAWKVLDRLMQDLHEDIKDRKQTTDFQWYMYSQLIRLSTIWIPYDDVGFRNRMAWLGNWRIGWESELGTCPDVQMTEVWRRFEHWVRTFCMPEF